MKKLFSLLLTFAICLSLCACGSTEKDNDKKNDDKKATSSSATKLILGENNSIADFADFTLFKVQTTKKVTASLQDRIYYENDNDGETYVDIILDWTNTSSEAVSSDDLLVATATNASDKKYEDVLYAVETNDAAYVSQYESIAPLSKVRFHCAISVPEAETELTLKLVIKGKTFTYDYTLGDVASNAKEINLGDTINAADFATLVFQGAEYTDVLKPSNPDAYSHYSVDNADNTYLVVKFDITNYASSEKECDTFAGVKALYMNKYTYTGFVVAERADGKSFSAYENIAPLETRHFYCLIEVPKTVTQNPATITLSFNGQEYTYAK